MPGIDAQIPLGIQQPNTMGTLNSVLQTANQVNQFRQGQIELKERQGVQGVLKNIKDYKDEQGNIDYNRLGPDIMAAAPTTGSAVLTGVMQAQNSATAAKQAVNSLDADSRKTVGEILYGLKGQDPMVVHNTLEGFKAKYPNMKPAVDFMGRYIIAPHVNDAKQFDDALDKAGRFVQSAPTQQTMLTPGGVTVNDNQTTKVVSTKPGTTVPQGEVVPGTEAQIKVSPENKESITTDANSNPVVVTRGQTGGIESTRSVPGAFQSLPAGETPQTRDELQGQRTAAQQAIANIPAMRNINDTVINLVDKGIPTGKAGAFWQDLKSRTGYNFGEDTATNYNVLGKMLERSAILASQAMGPHTNAGLESQIKANGSTEYTPQALRKIAYLNDALTVGSQEYQRGLETAIQNNGGSVFAKRKFDQQWAQTFDPTAMELSVARERGDKAHMKEIIDGLGGPGSKKLRDVANKLKNMDKLIQNGGY